MHHILILQYEQEYLDDKKKPTDKMFSKLAVWQSNMWLLKGAPYNR